MIFNLFLPSCRSWWAGRALPRRCIPSLYPHPFFHRLGKILLNFPNKQTFLSLVPDKLKKKKTALTVESIRALKNIYKGVSVSYNARGEKSTFKKRKSQKQQLGKTGRGEERRPLRNRIQVEGSRGTQNRASVSRCYPPASEINVRERTTSWLNHAVRCLEIRLAVVIFWSEFRPPVKVPPGTRREQG